MVTVKQAKNIAKELRLARATTGEESEKHFNNVDRLVEKYGVIIPDARQREIFDQKKTLEKIREHTSSNYTEGEGRKKVFYNYYEWSGWRFYLKAIRHADWKSIKQHIKDIYFK